MESIVPTADPATLEKMIANRNAQTSGIVEHVKRKYKRVGRDALSNNLKQSVRRSFYGLFTRIACCVVVFTWLWLLLKDMNVGNKEVFFVIFLILIILYAAFDIRHYSEAIEQIFRKIELDKLFTWKNFPFDNLAETFNVPPDSSTVLADFDNRLLKVLVLKSTPPRTIMPRDETGKVTLAEIFALDSDLVPDYNGQPNNGLLFALELTKKSFTIGSIRLFILWFLLTGAMAFFCGFFPNSAFDNFISNLAMGVASLKGTTFGLYVPASIPLFIAASGAIIYGLYRLIAFGVNMLYKYLAEKQLQDSANSAGIPSKYLEELKAKISGEGSLDKLKELKAKFGSKDAVKDLINNPSQLVDGTGFDIKSLL